MTRTLSSLPVLAAFLAPLAAQAQEPTPPAAPAPAQPATTPAQDPVDRSIEDRLRELEAQVKASKEELEAMKKAPTAKPAASTPKWFDRLSLRGYLQVRYTTLFDKDNTPNLTVPADRTVLEPDTIGIRRGRVTLSGDVTDRVYVYAQTEFVGSTGSGDFALQMRDFYGDYALDEDKEYRLRFGLSKVPYGFVNAQSSQNRLALERADGINSAAEGERDTGAYLLWAPKEVRERFKNLVKNGLKGSGDYGVIAVGAYTGQGPNRVDQNGEVHWVARASYPFEFENKQIVELGVQGYVGDYVVNTAAISPAPSAPTANAGGIDDERVAATFVLYPQPFGLEAEWNWGRGPRLSDDQTTITDEYLQGGYVQASWMWKRDTMTVIPFTRWNVFDGGRKFARNAPRDEVNELDVGVEWSPTPEIEFTLMYTHTFWRTDTTTAPFDLAKDVDRIGFQVQFNF